MTSASLRLSGAAFAAPSVASARMANLNDSAQLEALLHLQRELALEADIDRVLTRIVDTTKRMLDCERATLYVIDRGKNELWSRVLTESELTEIRLPLDGRSLAAGVALEYVQLSEELAAERLRVVKVAEEERHRLARDLHDGVAQTMANAAISIELVTRRAVDDVPGALADLVALRARLIDSQQGLRDILFALRPLALEDGGLPAAVA